MEKDYYEHMCHNSLKITFVNGKFNMVRQKADSVYASSGISFDFFSALGFEMAHFIRTFLQAVNFNCSHFAP